MARARNNGANEIRSVGNRDEVIRQACADIAALEAERKSIGDQIRAIKQQRVKGDLGMKVGDFNAVLRLYSLEGETRDRFFDTLRETFNALGIGQQLDWVDALSSEAPRRHADF